MDFGNGDLDTLTFDWEPVSIPADRVVQNRYDIDPARIDSYFYKVDIFRVYYNDSLVTEWRFKDDPDFKRTLINNNLIRSHDEDSINFEPIVFRIIKDPDWDELN